MCFQSKLIVYFLVFLSFIIKDDLGRVVKIDNIPQRIVSLGPSITEILFDLGVGNKVVGVTNFCDYPKYVLKLPKIGGFVNPNIEKIVSLHPDVVIGIAPGTRKEIAEEITSLGIPTYVAYPESLEDIGKNIIKIGKIVGKEEKAKELAKYINSNFSKVRKITKNLKKVKVLYLVGFEPFVTAGEKTFANDLIEIAKGENLGKFLRGNYPRCSIEWIISKSPDVIILSTMQKGITKYFIKNVADKLSSVPAVKNKKIFVINSALVDRPTVRIIKGLEKILRILHPELFK